MQELAILLAKASTNEGLILDIEKEIKNIKVNGETPENLGRLAASCHVFILKMLLGDGDVMEFIKKFNNDHQLLNAFNGKQ